MSRAGSYGWPGEGDAVVRYGDAGVPEKVEGVTRLLFIGDSHGHAGMLSRSCAVARGIGASEVWSVGDFGVWPGVGGRYFLDAVDEAAEECGVTVRVVPGNHDDYDQIGSALAERGQDGWASLRPRVLVAERGTVHKVHRTRIMCLSGAASIDGPGGLWGPFRGPGDGWWPQEVISEDDVSAACRNIDECGGAVELMVCHDLPSSEGVVGQADFLLGEQVRDRIRRVAEHGAPNILLAGHWHRHIDRVVDGRREVVLSADMVPDQVQWAAVDVHPDHEDPTLHVPGPWMQSLALT